jgi:hypothetical protein
MVGARVEKNRESLKKKTNIRGAPASNALTSRPPTLTLVLTSVQEPTQNAA